MKERTYHIFMIILMVLVLASVFAMFFISDHHVLTIAIFSVQLLIIIVYIYFFIKNERHFDKMHKEIENKMRTEMGLMPKEYNDMRPRDRFFTGEMGTRMPAPPYDAGPTFRERVGDMARETGQRLTNLFRRGATRSTGTDSVAMRMDPDYNPGRTDSFGHDIGAMEGYSRGWN